MTRVESFKLELVRPGPLHGQLLSKLTNYIALCDGIEADTFRLPFDHHELEADLQSLRYYVGDSGQRVPNELRVAALEKLSRSIANVIDPMRSFQTRFAEAVGVRMIHLRLVLGGSELSLVPFELTTVPGGWRGAGRKLSLEASAPVVVTRELRDSSRIRVHWNRAPRILVLAASPAGFQPPPLKAHLLAISRALSPWLEDDTTRERTIHDVVSVIENASLDSILDATRRHDYTHVHFLCHGAPMPNVRDRYGIALSRKDDPTAVEVVDARALSYALWGGTEDRKPPTMVMLASCDSANQSSVHAPGSSLAYELHQAGVPWVIASQMPLTFRGSATLARVWYAGVIEGRDPREVLNEVRQQLVRDGDAHDWASVVAYAAYPPELQFQLHSFRIAQLRRLIGNAIARVKRNPGTCDAEHAQIKRWLKQWEAVFEGADPSTDPRYQASRSEYLGMCGSIAKQIAGFKADDEDKRRLLGHAADEYARAASSDAGSHWTAVQYVSLRTLLGLPIEESFVLLAEGSAGTAWHRAAEGHDDRGWAAASLLELAIVKPDGMALARTSDHWAQELARLPVSGFVLSSTRRQLRRYTTGGMFQSLASPAMQTRAEEALRWLETRAPSPS